MLMAQSKTKTKYCPKCERDLLLGKFGVDKRAKDKLYYLCLECSNKAQKSRRACQKKIRRTKQGQRDHWLRRKFSITLEQHKQLYANQKGLCFSCGEPVQYADAFIDYDYKARKVGGLIDQKCLFKKNAEREVVYKGLQKKYPALRNLK